MRVCVCRFVHFHFFNRPVCVCVSEGPFVYIPLTESVPKFAHVTNSIQTNKHTHTHTCIFTYAVKAKVAMRTKTNETKWQREQEGGGIVVGTHIDLDNCLARKTECLQIWLKEELVMPWHHIGGQAFKFLLGCHIASFSRCLTMCTAVV